MSTLARSITRRSFLAGGLAAGVLPVWAEPGVARTKSSPNDKVVLGLIGCGGMGSADMHVLMDKHGVEVAALCDVDDARMPKDIQDVEKKYGRKPAIYKDYRKMLDRKDIDAIIVGTPDHWHALNLIHAVEAGKDAYCEKPISHDITEAKAMAAAVKHHKKIVQVGTWQRSTPEFVNAVEFIRSGKLGKVVLVRAWKTDDARMGHNPPASVIPSGLNYDMWMGPSAVTPYVPKYTHQNWRWFLNRGCGMTGDWGVHMMDIGLLAMSKNTDLPMPVEIAAYGGKLAWPDDDRTAPDTHIAIMKFKNPNFVMHWETGRDHPDRPDHGTEFVSEDGKTLTVWRGGWKVRDAGGQMLPKSRVPDTSDHWQNWLDCVRTRQQPRSNLASMAQTTIVCHLANVALLAGETIRWSKSQMDIVGRSGKDTQSYAREYRRPWKLPKYTV